MASRRAFWQVIVCGCAVVLLASCGTVHVHRTPNRRHRRKIVQGPPVHAKAHGHRMRHCGYDLTYNSSYGVYVVVGRSDCYYHEGHFYRFYRSRWEVSVRAESDWRPVVIESVPPGLRGRARAKVKARVRAEVKAEAKAEVKAEAKAEAKAKGYAKTNGKAKGHAKKVKP
jgi:hypothetical protein